jgi:thioesterase domain-containing protein
LLAIVLLVEIEEAFGVRVPPSQLMQTTTLADMAAAIDRQPEAPPASRLVGIQTEGRRPPLFWVHGGGGLVLGVSRLAFHLGSEQPLYAFQPRGFDGKDPPLDVMEDIAADYIQAMRAVQPRGPYRIAGFSFGGLAAFEMARQLDAVGEKTAFVGIVDSGCPVSFPLFHLARQRALYLWHVPPRQKLTSLRRFGTRQVRRVQSLLGQQPTRVGAWVLTPEVAPEVGQALERAGWNYNPRPWAGRVTYFRCESPIDPGAGARWARWATGGVEIIDIPGTHNLCMGEPHLGVLGTNLRGCLRAVAAAEPAPPVALKAFSATRS